MASATLQSCSAQLLPGMNTPQPNCSDNTGAERGGIKNLGQKKEKTLIPSFARQHEKTVKVKAE